MPCIYGKYYLFQIHLTNHADVEISDKTFLHKKRDQLGLATIHVQRKSYLFL